MSVQIWEQWLRSNVTAEQLPLIQAAAASASGNGSGVRVTRSPTDTLYMQPPAFEDVYGLLPLFSALAFEQNLIVKGPAGVGKSLGFYAWCANRKIPIVVEDCTEDTRDFRLKGTQAAIGGDFVYILGSLPTAIDVANEVGQCVLLFEEINALSPVTQKALNPIADFRKRISLPHIGRTYELRPDAKLWVCGTMNPSTFTGTYELNRDLRSRFEEVEVDYLDNDKEIALITSLFNGRITAGGKPISNFVRLAQETRKEKRLHPLAPRDLVRILFNAERLGLAKALSLVMGRADGDSKDLLKERIVSIFGDVPFTNTWSL